MLIIIMTTCIPIVTRPCTMIMTMTIVHDREKDRTIERSKSMVNEEVADKEEAEEARG